MARTTLRYFSAPASGFVTCSYTTVDTYGSVVNYAASSVITTDYKISGLVIVTPTALTVDVGYEFVMTLVAGGSTEVVQVGFPYRADTAAGHIQTITFWFPEPKEIAANQSIGVKMRGNVTQAISMDSRLLYQTA
jgi:hypothetical protein